jgi:ABC-type branched-subunit amino acid transport system substrate-binding protein
MKIATVSLLALAGTGCLQPTATPDSEGVPVGVLLPYTGELATVGQNLERAVIMANEHLAAAEPDPGKPSFRLIFRDTHSDDAALGTQAARDLLDQEKAIFILGPEEPRLADSMSGMLRDRTVAITGGAVSLDSKAGASSNWFRIVPTAKRMSVVLAYQMAVTDHTKSLAIIYVPDDYGTAFSKLAGDEFVARGGVLSMSVPLAPEMPIGELVRKVQSAHADAILLVAYPTVGAAVIQEWSILVSNERWYFAPSLQSEVFALNVPPGLIDGMVGIAAGLPADAPNFAREFKQRWRGEDPSPNAHYYFDAMLLAGLSYRLAAARGATAPRDLARALVDVSGPGGDLRTWQEVGPSLEKVEAGMDIDYRGASGTVDFSTDGNVPRGSIQGWTVRDGAIEYFPITLPPP